MLDKLKNLGFEYSTYSGITMSAFDIIADSNKEQIISDGKKKVDQIGKQYKRGLITEQERYERVIEVWNNANEQIKNAEIDLRIIVASLYLFLKNKQRN